MKSDNDFDVSNSIKKTAPDMLVRALIGSGQSVFLRVIFFFFFLIMYLSRSYNNSPLFSMKS